MLEVECVSFYTVILSCERKPRRAGMGNLSSSDLFARPLCESNKKTTLAALNMLTFLASDAGALHVLYQRYGGDGVARADRQDAR